LVFRISLRIRERTSSAASPQNSSGYEAGVRLLVDADRALSLLMRRRSPRLVLGIVLAAALIAAETLVVYPVRQVAPEMSLGVVHLLGVLAVWTVWVVARVGSDGRLRSAGAAGGLRTSGGDVTLVDALLRATRESEGMGSAIDR
jgi:hypothetical protein